MYVILVLRLVVGVAIAVVTAAAAEGRLLNFQSWMYVTRYAEHMRSVEKNALRFCAAVELQNTHPIIYIVIILIDFIRLVLNPRLPMHAYMYTTNST